MPDLGNVDFRLNVMEKYAKLHEDSVRTDAILVINGEKLEVHRFILATHSRFFRILLFGQAFREAQDYEIKLEAPLAAFKMLLNFMYTGTVDLRKYDVSDVADLLELTHRYEFLELETVLIEYLCFAIDAKNACKVLEIGFLLEKKKLIDKSVLLISMIIEGIYEQDLDLSYEMFKYLLKTRSAGQSEVKWFQTLQKLQLKKEFCSDLQTEELLKLIDLSKATLDQIVEVIQPSGLIKEKDLFQVIKSQSLYKSNKFCKNYCILENSKVLAQDNVELVFKSGKCAQLFHLPSSPEADTPHFWLWRSFIVDLKSSCLFNHMEFNLNQTNVLEYYIEVSKDDKTWIKIVDVSKCQSNYNQNLDFPDVIAQFFKLSIRFFSLRDSLKCTNFDISYNLSPSMNIAGLVYPTKNVLVPGKANVILMDFQSCFNRKVLDDAVLNEVCQETVSSQVVAAKIATEYIQIEFHQPYLLCSFRFKLLDTCSYRVTTSLGYYFTQETVCDKSDEMLNGWQTIKFSPRKVGAIFIFGIKAAGENELRVAHLEAPAK